MGFLIFYFMFAFGIGIGLARYDFKDDEDDMFIFAFSIAFYTLLLPIVIGDRLGYIIGKFADENR